MDIIKKLDILLLFINIIGVFWLFTEYYNALKNNQALNTKLDAMFIMMNQEHNTILEQGRIIELQDSIIKEYEKYD